MVFRPGRLEAADATDGGQVIRAVAADDERSSAEAEEPHLERTLENELLLRGATSGPVLVVTDHAGSLHPGDPGIAKVAQHLVQVVRSRLVVDVHLGEVRVIVAVGFQPRIYVTRFGLRLEWRPRRIPSRHGICAPPLDIVAGEVLDPA